MNLHALMIVIAASLCIVAMTFYYFAPPGKSEVYTVIITTIIGFLFGKFTNGFGSYASRGQDKGEPLQTAGRAEKEEKNGR